MLDAHTVRKAAAAIERVNSIDESIERLVEQFNKERHIEWGEVARNKMGSNLMHHVSSEALGEALFCGAVNYLLYLRGEAADPHLDVVSFPAPPCDVQKPSWELEG